MIPRAWSLAAIAVAALVAGCERPPIDTVQHGYRGLGMVELYNPRIVAAQADANRVPVALPAAPAGGPPASTLFKNLQVLGDLDAGQLLRLMTAMTQWVSPEQGCTYCHAEGDLASDALYTKVVARRMLQMTRAINTGWKTHVATTGVTCFTCHRGQPVPPNIWFTDPGPKTAAGVAGNRAGQNAPAPAVGYASLPFDPMTPFLDQRDDVRIVSTTALPEGNRKSIKQTEWTYALMMHMSQALGVNCTYCHNTRSFAAWDGSTPQRETAWYGIRLVRDLNRDYLQPLKSTLPAQRLGPLGDVPKLDCATCHNGAYKPLYGESMLKDYPELAAASPPASPSPTATPAASDAGAVPAAAAAPAAAPARP